MKVKGDNVLIVEYLPLIDEWVLYGCARSVSLSLSTETIQTSVTGAQGWQTSEPTQHSFTGSIEGLVSLEEENLLSLADLRQRQIERTKLRLRFQRTAVDGVKVYTEEADFYIVNSSDEGALNQMNSFAVEFKGTGALTQVFTPAQILSNVRRFQYTGIGGETSIPSVKDMEGNTISLAGKTVLGFEKDGIGFSKMITVGTPSDKQYKFTVGTGVIDIAIPFEPGEEAFGYYRN